MFSPHKLLIFFVSAGLALAFALSKEPPGSVAATAGVKYGKVAEAERVGGRSATSGLTRDVRHPCPSAQVIGGVGGGKQQTTAELLRTTSWITVASPEQAERVVGYDFKLPSERRTGKAAGIVVQPASRHVKQREVRLHYGTLASDLDLTVRRVPGLFRPDEVRRFVAEQNSFENEHNRHTTRWQVVKIGDVEGEGIERGYNMTGLPRSETCSDSPYPSSLTWFDDGTLYILVGGLGRGGRHLSELVSMAKSSVSVE